MYTYNYMIYLYYKLISSTLMFKTHRRWDIRARVFDTTLLVQDRTSRFTQTHSVPDRSAGSGVLEAEERPAETQETAESATQHSQDEESQ